MPIRACPYCGFENTAAKPVCGKCGHSLSLPEEQTVLAKSSRAPGGSSGTGAPASSAARSSSGSTSGSTANGSQHLPDTIGRYRLIEMLGSGAMGSVYRAVDPRTKTDIALKLVADHLRSSPEYLERFHREARAATKLVSPYSVRVFDLGTDDGRPYMAMEYVDGPRLSNLLRERGGRLEPVQALAIAYHVAQALDAAERAGVVHRDIKPDNIMLSRDDLAAKVTDFGIARLSIDAGLTMPGVFIGTIAYAAPEQQQGSADLRSDIYSLGVVLFQMLVGERPFNADTWASLMRQHEEAPPPLERLVGLPDEIVALVARCLEKDPASRFQHAHELVAEIDRVRQPYSPEDRWDVEALLRALVGTESDAGGDGVATPVAAAEHARATRKRLGLLPAFAIGVATTLLLLVILVVWIDSLPDDPTTPPPSSPTSERASSLTPSAAPAAAGGILFAEDFDDPSKGKLPRSIDKPGIALDYEGGEYALRKHDAALEEDPIVRIPGAFGDVAVVADVRVEGDARERRAILACRESTDQRSEYRVLFDLHERRLRIDLVKDGTTASLTDWLVFPASRQSYRMEFVCLGSNLIARVNEVDVAVARDSSLESGGVWIGAYGADSKTGEGLTVDFRLDNLVLRRPDTSRDPSGNR